MSNLARVGKVLIGKDVAVGSPATLNAVADGAIAVYDRDMTLLQGGMTYSDTETIFIVQGRGGDESGPRLSFPIHGQFVTGWKGGKYTAATKKKWTVGYDITAATGSIGLYNDAEYSLGVWNKSDEENVELPQRFAVRSALSGSTRLSILKDLAVAIKSNKAYTKGQRPRLKFTIVLVGDGVATTDVVYKGYTFTQVGFTDASVDANRGFTIEVTTANTNFNLSAMIIDSTLVEREEITLLAADMVFSFGSGADVITLENSFLGYLGYTNPTERQDPVTTFAASGTNYDIYTIELDKTLTHGLTSNQAPQVIYICIPTTAATWDRAQFEQSLNDWFTSLGKGFAPVNIV